MKVVLVSIGEGNAFGAGIPLAAAYLKANAMARPGISKNTEIDIQQHFSGENNSAVVKKICEKKPETVGFSCYVWNIEKTLEVSGEIRKIAPETKIVFGGPEDGPIAKKILLENNAVDVVIRGEAEETFAELLEHYLGIGKKIQGIKGIAFRKENNIFENSERQAMQNLDCLVSPYLSGTIGLGTQKEALLELSRGCTFNCRYCFDTKGCAGKRNFSLERIRRELEFLSGFISLRRLYLLDSAINIDNARAVEICKTAHDLFNGTIEIGAEILADFVKPDFARWLGKINTGLVETGLQSTNPVALRNMNRQTNPGRFEKGIGLLKKEELPVQIDLISGLPGDNLKALKNSFGYAARLKPKKIMAFDLLVLPGTYFYKHPGEFGLEFNPKPMHEVWSSYTASREEIKQMKAHAAKTAREYNQKQGAKKGLNALNTQY